MTACDVLIVGGGPAGSTCARLLRRAGWRVVVADAARFPRDKVCAGWLTPEVFRLLELDPEEYRRTGLTLQAITGFRTGVLGAGLVHTAYGRVVSYAIRRCEFDQFLLRRADVHVRDGAPIRTLMREGGRWVADGRIAAPVVVGAGGHFCPVARHLRGGADHARPVIAREAECHVAGPASAVDEETPELFFSRDLEGYGWCVRKGHYLNVGIGRRPGDGFATHVTQFMRFLEDSGRLGGAPRLRWRGHAYLAEGAGSRPIVGPGVLLVGDAAGLAYPESGEGIRPAIESGRLAAETLIALGGCADAEALRGYADALRRRHPPVRRTSPALRPLVAAAGRRLLASPVFTRRVVLDRWFLRA
jgi:geranylgeranyl reductase family protein